MVFCISLLVCLLGTALATFTALVILFFELKDGHVLLENALTIWLTFGLHFLIHMIYAKLDYSGRGCSVNGSWHFHFGPVLRKRGRTYLLWNGHCWCSQCATRSSCSAYHPAFQNIIIFPCETTQSLKPFIRSPSSDVYSCHFPICICMSPFYWLCLH